MDTWELYPSPKEFAPAEFAPVDPNTCWDISLVLLKYVAIVAAAVFILGAFASKAHADDSGNPHSHHAMPVSEDDPAVTGGHPKKDMKIHEIFYSDWDRLDMANKQSCCNNQDCFPTIMLKRDGSWWALKREWMVGLEARYLAGENPAVPEPGPAWAQVSEHVLEHNSLRVDLGVLRPREERPSPDGRSHACISGSTVLCAVVGNGM